MMPVRNQRGWMVDVLVKDRFAGMGFYTDEKYIRWLLGIGVLIVFVSLLLLIIYSFRSVRIRRKQFEENIDDQ